MNFVKFRDNLIEHFSSMEKELGSLFTVDLDKDKLYEHYLSSYPAGTNPMFRKRTEHDCSCCRHFIKSIGNVVGIKDGQIISIWDFDCGDKTYQTVSGSIPPCPIARQNLMCEGFHVA